jgi:twitching motility two-component system response regulator PilG
VSGARILVVDDSLTIRRALELILKPLGYELDFAADGAQALERATAFIPDLILLDYVLPDMRAPDVCAALAATPSTAFTPIVLVSAKGASIRQAYQDASNVVSYITKPFKPQVVASVVQNALARARAGAAAAPGAAASVRATPVAREVHEAIRPRNGDGAAAPPPASIEQAFAVLLAQLEGAICEERSPSGARQGSFPGVSPRLKQAAARLDDISRHLHGDTVVPYRVRDDGSFANVAATLLEAHRALCEAAILLAATGAPSAALPRSPDVIVVCPLEHAAAIEIPAALRDANFVPLLVGEDFAQLPHLMRLIGPRAMVGVPGKSAAADAALQRSRMLEPGLRFVALRVADANPLELSDTTCVDDVGAIVASLSGIAPRAARNDESTCAIDLEVVSI